MRQAFLGALVGFNLFFLLACGTNSPSSEATPGPQTATASGQTTAPNDVRGNNSQLPTPPPASLPTDNSEAESIAKTQIEQAFQPCDNGYTYTMIGQRIIEVENFGYTLTPGKPPSYVDLKNGLTWAGQIALRARASRSYDILNARWSNYDTWPNGVTVALAKENGAWTPALSDYKRPACQDVQPYLSVSKERK